MGGKLWRRVPDSSGKAKLKEVDLTQLTIERPTIVYLSGFLTNNNRPEYVAGSIKSMEELLKNQPPENAQPDIYGWSHKGLSNLFNLAAYDTFPGSRASSAGYTLAANILMPLVAEDFKRLPDGSVQGNPRPVEEAAQRLRNVTFFGYSAGSVVAQETFNASLKMMKGVGYDEKEARKLLKDVALITVGSISRSTKEIDRFSTVTLVASNDRINRFKNWIWGAVGTLYRTFSTGYTLNKHVQELRIHPLSASNIFVSAAVRPSLFEYSYDEAGVKKKKEFTPLYPKWAQRRSYHEIPHYLTTDDDNNGFSRIARHALINAIGRTGTPEPIKLLEPCSDVSFDEEAQNAYRKRIEQALKPTPARLVKK